MAVTLYATSLIFIEIYLIFHPPPPFLKLSINFVKNLITLFFKTLCPFSNREVGPVLNHVTQT